MSELRILCVHGLGDHRQRPWQDEWRRAIEAACPTPEGLSLDFAFHTYDHLFEEVEISPFEALRAVGKLLKSGVASLFRAGPVGRARGAGATGGASHFLRWYAGYVVAWAEDKGFQRKTRRAFLAALRDYRPDVVLAHSLGSLITYDALTHPDGQTDELRALTRHMTYVTLGSQIGNAFVVGNLTLGRVVPLDVHWWYHLYNREDDVFTAPIRLWDAANFTQVDTFFDVDGWMDHGADGYLGHRATTAQVWDELAHEKVRRLRGERRERSAFTPLLAARGRGKRKPRRRALLVGINDYPNAEDRLEGCVNDVFLMSSLLQECGFEAEDVRVVLDERATAEGILRRLDWLLDDPREDDQLVFYYSGHGAQLPTYGEGDVVDQMDETLVPWDFDWSPESCVTDDQIFALYSQLPYGTQLVTIFDCCHSGGIHRAGGPRAKGLNPPDDIRHRGLRWDPESEMWVPRDLDMLNRKFTQSDEVMAEFFGSGGVTSRLGRGSSGRQSPQAEYTRAKRKSERPVGPFLPVIIEACAEDEFAYEYRHGVTSYGAFTYSLATILRRRRSLSFQALVHAARDQLAELGYDQVPQILGPRAVVTKKVPWTRAHAKASTRSG